MRHAAEKKLQNGVLLRDGNQTPGEKMCLHFYRAAFEHVIN